MMKDEFLNSYNGYHLGPPMHPLEPPSLSLPLGNDHSDDDAICKPPQPGTGCRREEFVGLGLEKTLNNFFSFEFLELLCFHAHGEKGPNCIFQHLQAAAERLQRPRSCNYRPQGVPGTIAVAEGAFAL